MQTNAGDSVTGSRARLPSAPYPEEPDLDALINTFGSYSAVPWGLFDAAMEEWHRARRIHTVGFVLYPVLGVKQKSRKKRR